MASLAQLDDRRELTEEGASPAPRRPMGWTSASGAKLLRRYIANPVRRVPTGLPFLDPLIGGGIGVGEVGVVVAKSGVGKSFFAQHVLESNLGVPTAFASLEMPGPLVIRRSLAIWAKMSSEEVFQQIEKGELDDDLLERWAEAHAKTFYSTLGSITIDGLARLIEEAEEQIGEKPALVAVDYLELVKGSVGEGAVEQVTGIAEQLKSFAKEHEVGLLVLHQANRGLQHGRPPHEDSSRYGGFTEADVVFGLWDPSKWRPQNRQEENDFNMDQVMRWEGWRGVNIIKNRILGRTNHLGWNVRLTDAGGLKVDNPHDWRDNAVLARF